MSYIDILPTADAGGFPSSPRGFPVSTRRARFGFHRPWSYRLSAGFKYRESHGMYVLSSIDVPIMMDATFWACPGTRIKLKRVENMSAIKAAFGGWVPLIDFDQVSSVPLGFVFQLGHELTPTDITDGFTELWVLDHVLHRKVLDTDRLVLTNQTCRELVREITAAISDTSMDLSDFLTGLFSVLAALLFLGMSALGLGKLLLILAEKLWIAHHFPIREHDEGFQAQIGTDRRRSHRQVRNVLFYQDGNEVAVCSILGDGDTTWLGSLRQGTRPHDIQGSIHLGKGEARSIPSKGIVRIGSRLLVMPLLECGVLSTSFKEVEKRTVEMPQGLLQGNRRDLVEPAVFGLLLELGQGFREVFIVQAALLIIEGIRLLAQGPIIDEAATAEGTSKKTLLLVRWIDSILVGSLLFHTYMIVYGGVTVKQSTHLPPLHKERHSHPAP